MLDEENNSYKKKLHCFQMLELSSNLYEINYGFHSSGTL